MAHVIPSGLGDPMTRKEILQSAEKCVCGDREQQYASPENNFTTIAMFWNTYLMKKRNIKPDITPEDVAVMMALLKIARISDGKFKADSFVDACGYLACAGEIEAQKPMYTDWHGKE